jgi:alkylation response protein AidB-like acyl-CoA dehydrogenase
MWDLTPNDDQKLLRDAVRRLVSDAYSTMGRRDILGSSEGFSRSLWRKYGELGWLSLTFPEAFGGWGASVADVGIVMEEFGRALVAEPYLSTVLLGAQLVADIGSEAQRGEILTQVAAGELLLAFAHAEPTSRFDPAAIETTARRGRGGWILQGEKTTVIGGPSANQLVVSAKLSSGGIGLFLVPMGTAGLRSNSFTILDGRHASNVVLDHVPLKEGALLGGREDAGEAIQSVTDRAVMAQCAFAVGALQALLEKTVEYLNTRTQFGKPLAHNQVLRHRVADMALRCEEARSITLRAALTPTGDAVARGLAASAAKIKLGRCARFVAEQAVQLHGAMGVTEELDIGLYFKSLLTFELLLGTAEYHRRRYLELRRSPAGSQTRDMADLGSNEQDEAFRAEVVRFIGEHLPADLRRSARLTPSAFSDPEVIGPWQTALNARGWVAPDWPKEVGGPGWSLSQRRIFERECAKAHAPPLSPNGVRMVGPVIIKFGTQEQKDFYLPRILSGEDFWCQGYSEPGAGSDLASLKTRAVVDGDDYVINGTKIWTTHAHFATRMFALVRTSEGPRKQDGISFILIDMKSPGITIRPILTIGGDHEVNQVFLDNVRVPQANRVGAEGAGWSYGKYLLEFERGAGSVAGRMRQQLADVEALLHKLSARGAPSLHESFVARFCDLEMDIDAFEMLELRMFSIIANGASPGILASYIKALFNPLRQEIQRLGVDILGERGLAWEADRPLYRLNHTPILDEDELAVVPRFLDGRASTIFGGTAEIQRDIIARDLLGK